MSIGTGGTRESLRRGRVDDVDLARLDLVKFNQGRNPYASPFIAGGFRPGKEYFRKIIADWGFTSCGKIADICSGYARWSVFLAEVNEFVCGLERNRDAITLSRRLCEYLALDNVSFEAAERHAAGLDARRRLRRRLVLQCTAIRRAGQSPIGDLSHFETRRSALRGRL